MGDPSINPFEGSLWVSATQKLANDDQGVVDGIPSRLTGSEYRFLVKEAAGDEGVITAQEKALLDILSNPKNVDAITRAYGSKGTFRPAALTFEAATPLAGELQQCAVAGHRIHDQTYRQKEVDRYALQHKALTTTIKPGGALNLTSEAGRYAILDSLAQLAQFGDGGGHSCTATSIVALAVRQGKEGLVPLCQVLLQEAPHFGKNLPLVASLLDKLQKDQPFSLAELGVLAQGLYETCEAAETLSGLNISEDVYVVTIQTMLNRHADALKPLFADGAKVMGIDNNGDLNGDHLVASFPYDGGTAVFDPWERKDGHHLVTGDDARLYLQAQTDSFAVGPRQRHVRGRSSQ